MNTRNKRRIAGVALCLSLSMAGGATSFALAGEAPVSPALEVIAGELSLAKAGLCGEEIVFEASDFSEALGVESVDSIVIRSLPSPTAGKLMLGELEVMKNQTVGASDLDALRFVPTGKGVSESNFVFEADGVQTYEVICKLYLLAKENAAPTAAGIDAEAFTTRTYRNIAVYGALPIIDPEGDSLTFEIVSSPKNGLLVLTDKEEGTFVYTPTKNYSGKDSFRYVVTDRYGNRSSEETVTVKVSRSEEGTVFTDMIGHPAHYSAILLSDHGIMTGKEVDGETLFDPNGAVSRAAFLAMTMNALGIEVDLDASVTTVFHDDREIPAAYRAYVAVAYEKGYIRGFEEDGLPMFDPNGEITRAEASVIIDHILDPDVPVIRPVFADGEKIPAWAKEAMVSLYALGILSQEDGYVSPEKELTRAEVAQMLSALLDL